MRGPKGPALPAEVLYSYPSDKPLANGESIADFCFPHGVQPVLCERTPSMSGLNEVIYGQHFHDRDDHSFVFVLKVGGSACCYGWVRTGSTCTTRTTTHSCLTTRVGPGPYRTPRFSGLALGRARPSAHAPTPPAQ